MVGQGPGHEFGQLLGGQPDDADRLHVLDGGDGRQGLVPPGLGQKRDVVAHGLVAIGLADIDDLHPAQGGEGFVGEIAAGGDGFDAGKHQGTVLGVFDDHQNRHA